jgi:hypothetical protein
MPSIKRALQAEAAKNPGLSQLMRAFVLSAVDYACNDTKMPYPIVQSRYEMWKKSREDKTTENNTAEEKYIVKYANRRTEYESAYEEWSKSRENIIQSMKVTNVIGKQEELMAKLLALEFPDILTERVEDVYTKHRANA